MAKQANKGLFNPKNQSSHLKKNCVCYVFNFITYIMNISMIFIVGTRIFLILHTLIIYLSNANKGIG